MKVETQVEVRVKTPDRILVLLSKDGSLTQAEVAEGLYLSKSTVERAIAKLKKEGLLTFIGPKKSGYWQVLS